MNQNRHDPSNLHDYTEQSRAGLYKGHTFSHLIYIEIFIHSFHFIRLRERLSSAHSSGLTANTGSAFFCWEIISSWETNCHYSRSTTARAILVLRRLCPTQDLICKQVLFWFSYKRVNCIFTYCLRFCKTVSIKHVLCSSYSVLFCIVFKVLISNTSSPTHPGERNHDRPSWLPGNTYAKIVIISIIIFAL